MTIEGIPNQLFANGMIPIDVYNEARRFFAGAYKKSRAVDDMTKNLALADVTPTKFFKDKYALWLDFRSSQDNFLHGSGHKIQNTSEGVTVAITRDADTGAKFNASIYAFIFMDGVLNIVSSSYGGIYY